jgi:hypothetical protein
MALLAEEIVEEWLNRQGFFTIRGIKVGVDEIDILAMRMDANGKPICRHVEVQASINPVSYLTSLAKALQKEQGISAFSMKHREPDVMKRCVKEWIAKKFHKAGKVAIRRKLCDANWTLELVVNRVKHEEELAMVEEVGIRINRLPDIIKQITSGELLLQSASGADLMNLVWLGKTTE